jgi:hypothetical protein
VTDTYTESGVVWTKVEDGECYTPVLDKRGRVVGERMLCKWGRYERADEAQGESQKTKPERA